MVEQESVHSSTRLYSSSFPFGDDEGLVTFVRLSIPVNLSNLLTIYVSNNSIFCLCTLDFCLYLLLLVRVYSKAVIR